MTGCGARNLRVEHQILTASDSIRCSGAGFEPLGPRQRLPHQRTFGLNLSADAGLELDVFSENPQRILAHLSATKQLRNTHREVQPGLQHARVDFDSQIMVGQQQSPAHVRGLTAGIEKPGGRTRGIHMQQLQEFLLQVPEVAQGLL